MTQMDPEKIDKHVNNLAKAVEKTYGSTWHVIWRNFLAGIAKALGATIGYVIFIGLAVIIAQRLGVFDYLQNAFKGIISHLPFDQGGQIKIDPAMLEQFQQ